MVEAAAPEWAVSAEWNHADHANRLFFDVETGVGSASRWNTLRGFRVLDWYGI